MALQTMRGTETVSLFEHTSKVDGLRSWSRATEPNVMMTKE